MFTFFNDLSMIVLLNKEITCAAFSRYNAHRINLIWDRSTNQVNTTVEQNINQFVDKQTSLGNELWHNMNADCPFRCE